MGYYATIDGEITLKKPVGIEAILDRISDFIYENEPEVSNETDDNVTFRFGGYQRYHDDEIFDFLAETETITVAGEITYFGEDNSLWRHYFDPSKKRWFEQNGHVEYESEGKTITSIQEHYAALRADVEQSLVRKRNEPER